MDIRTSRKFYKAFKEGSLKYMIRIKRTFRMRKGSRKKKVLRSVVLGLPIML